MCLSSFHSEEKLNDQKTYCGAHKPVKIELPKSNENILQFVEYAECMLQKIETCQPTYETSCLSKTFSK